MRLLIDVQGLQTSSRSRGIGHYTISLVKEILKSKDIEVLFLLNDYSPEGVEFFCQKIENECSVDRVHIFKAPNNVSRIFGDEKLRFVAEAIRNYYINVLEPDFLLITSLFEGASEDFACNILQNRRYKVGLIGYDLIPLYDPDLHLPTPEMKAWYYEKIAESKKADVIFSISESSKREFSSMTNIDESEIVNISSAGDSSYKPLKRKEEIDLNDRFSIEGDFILYSGACDERKNLKGLLTAFSLLTEKEKERLDIVLVGKYSELDMENLSNFAKKKGISKNKIIFTGFISNHELKNLYGQCHLFVFPSFHEGFGLPVLEAMMCGAVTICSNVSSLPEVIELEEAMFSPNDVNNIAKKMQQAINDESFRDRLLENAKVRSTKFSWKRSAEILLNSIREIVKEGPNEVLTRVHDEGDLINEIFICSGYEFTDKEIRIIANNISDNSTALEFSRFNSKIVG